MSGRIGDVGTETGSAGSTVYEFSLEDHVPQDHLQRSIDRFVDLDDIRQYLAEFYSHTGRPSIDPELLIRICLLYTSPSPRDKRQSRMPSSA